jgi:glycosyltransferase involved in cell wall biosynthesis
MKLTAIVLSHNEEMHIERCIASILQVTPHVLVIDSFSTDKTVELATACGAMVLQHPFSTHASQLNWGLGQIPADSDWVLRVDADEYLDETLVESIRTQLPKAVVDGLYIKRRLIFQGRDIRHGMVYPVYILRLFRRGKGRCIERLMDEHVQVEGLTATLPGTLYDHSLRSLSWWTAKHNRYASLEAIEQLNLKYHFLRPATIGSEPAESKTLGFKRLLKQQVYGRLPTGARAFMYFFFRYVLALGFLDGKAGTAFHFLQGLWYRYLVDAKINEVERVMSRQQCDIRRAIESTLDVKLP